MSHDVFVLGAGFSKEVANSMPVMAELTDEMLTQLGQGLQPEWTNTVGQNVELLLTHLSSRHPWWSPAAELANRSLYHRLTALLVDIIKRRQHCATSTTETAPDWLRLLVQSWHERTTVVITFNYDTLIEQTVHSAIPVARETGPPFSYRQLYPVSLTPAHSRGHSGGGLGRPRPLPTFKLLKLHGSVNWYYSGHEAPPGDTVYDAGVSRQWGVEAADGVRFPQDVADKVPLIVPPTLEKGPQLINDVVRAQWREARHALEQAGRVVCMGYSLPATDLATRFLLGTLDDPPEVLVVNRSDAAEDHYKQLLRDYNVVGMTGDAAIHRFVNAEIRA